MKKLLTTIFAISTLFVTAQTPQGINYQSIIRTTGGIVIPNTVVNMEFKLYNGLAGALVYHEAHTPTTNSFGMANLIIGQGSPISGTFNTITWSNGISYEVYVNSVLIGTKQLFMSVPYALHAGSAPAPTVTFTNNILSVGGNTTAITSGVTYTAGNGIDITGSVISGTANIIGTGATSVTGIYPNLTINSPTVQSYSAGNGINIDGAGVITNTAPPAPAYTLTTNSNSITINNGSSVSTATVPSYSAGNGINVSSTGVITNTASSTNLPAAFNGQFLYNNGSTWDTIPQQSMIFDPVNIKIGIGTFSPQANLHVNGDAKFNTSINTPQVYTRTLTVNGGGVGQVITSDAAGNGTWQAPVTPTITGTGIAAITPTTGNAFNVDVPAPILGYNNGTNVLSLSQGTTVTTATLVGTGTNTTTIVGSGLATVTPTTGSTFTVSVPNPTIAISNGSLSISNGNSVAIPSPSLTINSNSLTINGPGGNTVLLPANTISGIGTGAASVTTSANNFTVSVPNPTFTTNGPTTISGAYPNYTVNSVTTASTTLIQGNNISLNQSGSTYTVSAPAYSISLPGGNTVQITNGTSTSTAAIASTSLTLTGVNNSILSAGGNTVGLNTYTAGTGISVTGTAPNFVINNTSTAITPTITGIGMASVTPVGNTFTVSVPSPSYTAGTGILSFGGTNTVVATPSLSIAGNVLRSGPATNTVVLPPPIITGTGTGIATVTTSASNFTVNVPSPTYAPSTGVLSFGTSTVVVSPTLSLTGTTLTSGAATNTVNLSSLSVWSNSVGVLYPTTLTNSVGIGTSGPLTDKMEIKHASSPTNAHLHLKQIGADSSSRIKFSNAVDTSKFWLNAIGSVANDMNSGYNFYYHNGTIGRSLFTVVGSGKVSVNIGSLPYPTLFEVNGGFELDSTIAVNGLSAMPPVSLLNTGKIYFDRPNNKFKVSENGGAYVDLLGGGSPSPWIRVPGRVTLNDITDSVGIGTTTPTSKLHVLGSSDPLLIAVENTAGAFKTGYKIKTNSQEWFIGKETGGSNALRFSDITSGQVRMAIETSGNVGIGTTAPTANLHVVNIGTVSPASIFDITDPTNANNTIEVYNSGIGTSILATNTSSTNAAARFTNTGQGMALSVENTSNTDPTAYILNNGTGPALVVNGKTTITDGTQGLGKVLTSDASGNASWQVNAPLNRWSLTGNLGTVDVTNFVGTTDDIAFNIRVNNQKAGRISNSTGTTTFFGYQSGNATTGIYNSAFGHQALFSNTAGQGNTAIGFQTLWNNTTGNFNIAMGKQALMANSTGGQNVAIGDGALMNNTTGNFNTGNGGSALDNNTIGSSNVGLGNGALSSNKAGSNATAIGYNSMLYANNSASAFVNSNVALGFEALRGSPTPASNTGNYNTSLGYQTLFNNTSGGFNTATGDRALYSNTTATGNAAYGNQSLYLNTTGNDNTATGAYSLYSNTNGAVNSAFGGHALYLNTSGFGNTASGTNALYFNTIGNNNVASGYEALISNTTGNGNVAMGYHAGYTLIPANANTTGSYNIFLGYNSGPGVASASNLQNAIAIGKNALVNSSNALVLGGTGVDAVFVGINTTTPSERLDVSGNVQIPAVNDYKYASAKIKYLNIPSNALHSMSSSYGITLGTYVGGYDGESGYAYIANGVSSSSIAVATAAVYLPDGAVVTELFVRYFDQDATYDGVFSLERKSILSINNETMASYTTAGNSSSPSGSVSQSIITITNPAIDNANFAYYFKFKTYQLNTNIAILDIRIKYTVLKAD